MEESLALALPQQQVAFAAWHLFLEGGCQEGANPRITRLVCPPESLHEGGVCAAQRGGPEPALVERVRVRGEPRSLKPEPPPHPPGESQKSRGLRWGQGGADG